MWAEIERGAGTRLPFRAVQFGDERCNRTAFGFQVGERWVALLDDRDPADLRVRDAFYRHLGGMNFSGAPLRLLLPRLARAALAHPGDLPLALPTLDGAPFDLRGLRGRPLLVCFLRHAG